MSMCILRFIRSLDVIRNPTREFPLSRVLISAVAYKLPILLLSLYAMEVKEKIGTEVNLSVTLFEFFGGPFFFCIWIRSKDPARDGEKQYNILIKSGSRNKNNAG